jgi:hypothetical protein
MHLTTAKNRLIKSMAVEFPGPAPDGISRGWKRQTVEGEESRMDDGEGEGGLFARRWEAKVAELALRQQALGMGLAFIVVVVLVVGLLGWVLL